MNKQIALSIEQMTHLEELGLNTSDASMYWALVDGGFGTLYNDLRPNTSHIKLEKNIGTSYNEYYAYTLQDILEKIKTINYDFGQNDKENLSSVIDTHSSGSITFKYEDRYGDTIVSKYFPKNNILENFYQMLLWCIENGYIKTSKNI